MMIVTIYDDKLQGSWKFSSNPITKAVRSDELVVNSVKLRTDYDAFVILSTPSQSMKREEGTSDGVAAKVPNPRPAFQI